MAASEGQTLELTLARAAVAFKDADFFESNILFWSAALNSTERELLEALASDLDLEHDLGLDVQADQPIDLVFPRSIDYTVAHVGHLSPVSISSVHTYILTAICYLSRHINVRMDILPSGHDTTLTSLGSPQRFFATLTANQRQMYHTMLAIVLTTSSSIPHFQRAKIHSHDEKDILGDQLRVQQTTVIGNESTSPWQTILPTKKSPHGLPRFFSFLNSSSCTVAGSSIPRNEQDIEALEMAGFKLVVTLIKESPLSPQWFHQIGSETRSKSIRNAFIPIENRKAPGFPEVFEVVMGWCVHAGKTLSTPDSNLESTPPHQNATLIHCGGGKGRAGIMLAAHLIRFGLIGHEMRGYCSECLSSGNVHRYDLDQFRKGLGDQASVAATLPSFCVASLDDDDDDDDSDDDESEENGIEESRVRVVKPRSCLNRFQNQMSAKDAIAHLRELRPGSIETVEQEKAVKAYGDWLWRRSSKTSKVGRSRESSTPAQSQYQLAEPSTNVKAIASSERLKGKKDRKKDVQAVSKTRPEMEPDVFLDDEFERGARKGNKKGKKGRQSQQEEPQTFVPPPAHKIIKLPGSGKGSHHQHHLVVQHNIRAKQLQLQRGQKAKKGGHGGGKLSKERPSFQVTGTPLESPPRLIILTGLPGSGKTHLVSALLQRHPDHFVRISQDELGSRSVCERLLAQSMRHQQQSLTIRGPAKALPMSIIIDRCNPTALERKEWYEVAFQPDSTAMVWFSMSADKCTERARAREDHPTVAPDMAAKVVKSFASSFEIPHLGKEGWCSTLVEVGDDEGSDHLFSILSRFAKDIPGSSSISTGRTAEASATPIKARPAFIPARALQRKMKGGAGATDGGSGSLAKSSSKLPSSGTSMASVEEESDEDEEQDEEQEEELEDEEEKLEQDEEDEETLSESDGGSEDGPPSEGGPYHRPRQQQASSKTHEASDKHDNEHDSQSLSTKSAALASASTMSISTALQFASPTGHRPAVKKPAKGSWKGAGENSSTASTPKGVSFASPLSSFDRPLQKFPRTPHLYDPLTIRKSRESSSDTILEHSPSDLGKRSAAITRFDLLLPPSALDHIFAPKAHQVLTVEEKMDGANIGFSVLHFKSMSYGGSNTAQNKAVPPPKIRVQNRNHFVHPDDHWQFKKLFGWLEKHRDDILWLCEGNWRYGPRNGHDRNVDSSIHDPKTRKEMIETAAEEIKGQDNDSDDGDDDDNNYEDMTDSDDSEYVDENKVLQDGMAPYVLYGEWLYAKHSVQYTGLRSWFVPFDLFDVKTGTFVSRAVFQKAIQQTQLVANPVVTIPRGVYRNVEKMLDWTLEKLYSRSVLMRNNASDSDRNDESYTIETTEEIAPHERVEGLYFRVDQGDRLLTRCKVVRPDFIPNDERWGVKEQLANMLSFDAHYASHRKDDDDDDDEDDDSSSSTSRIT
ncbi:hypothetical protein BG004_001990 [Podila humilis]|nr:hypothetical protein BG004_001990 [Podila humilis]